MPTYRAAIIGTGRIAHTYDDEVLEKRPPSYYQGENRHLGFYVIFPVNHAESIQTTPGYELVAAANRSEAKLHEFGARRNVSALYTDFREMLRQEQPDVVSVCTQSPEKAEVTIACDGAAALELGLACHASHLAAGPVMLPLPDRTLRVHNR